VKIALLTHSINPRGGVVHVLELGRALLARGHAVTIIAPAQAGQRLFRATPCRVEYAALDGEPAPIAELVRRRIDAMRATLTNLLQHERFDVLHAHDGIGGNALADLVLRGTIGGYVRTVHHVDRFDDAQLQSWEERSIRDAAQVLCVSRLWRERLRRDYGIAASLVTNGVDLERFRPEPCPGDADIARRNGMAAGRPVVLGVGGVEARKNSVRLLNAFMIARGRLPALQLVIAGGASVLDHSAELRAFHETAAAAGLHLGPGADVTLTGPVADDDLPALLRRADVLAMPSLIEGFGLAALEALASGTPAVVSRIAPFTEHFRPGDVFFADPLQPMDIAQALVAAIDSGRSGAAPAVCHAHSWSASARRHDVLYRQFEIA